MKLETFFEKFDQFADAPDAVEKMRELLLNFAVTGRLSEQRAGDAPVSELLDALSASKARHGTTGRRGAPTAVPLESIIDRPVAVPAHWSWVSLNQIGAMSGGMTPSKDKSAFWNGDINWFSSKDIKTDELLESELKITREATEGTGLQVYSPGCLVMVARSGILKRTFPVSILRVEGTVNQDLKVLSPFVPGLERYLQIMLRGMTAFILKDLVKTGMTVQSLKYEEFESQPFPLPPLAEQKRIVAKVDELMALCDRLEAQQQERETRHAALARASLARFADAPTPANLPFLFHPSYAIRPADLRKSILTLAVQGKLVPQDPSDEPAEDSPTTATSLPSEVDKAPFEVPSDWRWKKLGAIALIERGGSPRPIKDYITNDPNGLNWIKIGDTEKGGKYITSTEEKIRPEGLAKTRKVYPGDFLLTNSMSFGRPYISKIEGCIHDGWLRIHPPDQVETDFLYHLLSSPYVYSFFRKAAAGAVVQNLNADKVRELAIPLPPLAEQRRIVAKVEQLMTLVDALETQLAASRATAANLLSALVAELTGTPHNGKISVPSVSTTGSRGRSRKSA